MKSICLGWTNSILTKWDRLPSNSTAAQEIQETQQQIRALKNNTIGEKLLSIESATNEDTKDWMLNRCRMSVQRLAKLATATDLQVVRQKQAGVGVA